MGGHCGPRKIRRGALEPSDAERARWARDQSLQVRQLPQGSLLRQRHKGGLLSGAPFDNPDNWFLSNDQIRQAAQTVNNIAGRQRLLFHSLFTPKQPGWLDEVDRCIASVRPTSWKGYTIGDPLSPQTTKYPWRLDDAAVMGPFYDRIVKAGITTVCIHKGLMPKDYETSIPGGAWRYANVDDVGQAAKQWPQVNFVIYHSALRAFLEDPQSELDKFERTGEINWVSDLARIPEKFGVSNVYCDLGTSFAISAVTNPRFCAAMLGTLIKGLGHEHVFWGTDSVWYGSPQWQIEAFRRLEIPEDMQKQFGFAPLGAADGRSRAISLGTMRRGIIGSIWPLIWTVTASVGSRLLISKTVRSEAISPTGTSCQGAERTERSS